MSGRTWQFHQYGENAVLIDTEPGAAAAVAAHARRRFGALLLDAVPTADCVLLDFAGPTTADHVSRSLSAEQAATSTAEPSELVVLAVTFDGPDLASVAATVGGSTQDVIGLLVEADLQVEFCGFAPGFAYLKGLPPALHLPRRSTPRTRVPAGSVALAAGYAAVYPAASPGGWHLVGQTSQRLFNPDDASPALLQPGTRVRFAVA